MFEHFKTLAYNCSRFLQFCLFLVFVFYLNLKDIILKLEVYFKIY
jgi:hypothetical protein